MTPENPDCSADMPGAAKSDLIAELGVVRDSVEELYLLLDHIWRNREELYDILEKIDEQKTERREDETVLCCRCDDSLPSLAEAVNNGWTDFQSDRALEWSYLGICLKCHSEGGGQATVRSKNQKRLFA